MICQCGRDGKACTEHAGYSWRGLLLCDKCRDAKSAWEATVLDPYVGMPCTVAYMTDRVAATVIYVSRSLRKVVVQEDLSTRTDQNGMSDQQAYSYERDPNGKWHTFYRRGDGYAQDGVSLRLGYRNSYHDYSF